MPRATEAVQAERAGRSHIAPLGLVKLTTYTDRTAATVDKVFYFSTLPCTYDYANTGNNQTFLPVIIGGSAFFSGFQYLAQPDELTAFNQSFNLQLDNREINGSPLATLLQAHNLEGATIEIGQLLLDSMDSVPLDLTGYVGTEHLVLFPGRVDRVGPITEAMLTIECSTELPNLADSWIYATDDTKTDPLDLGKRLPRVYGRASHVAALNYNVGWVTTIIEDLTDSETGSNYKITDGSGFPSGSFNSRIDGEELGCSGADASTLDIDSRGTPKTAHSAGAVISELISTATYIVNDHESSALTDLYVINPLNGMLLRLDSGATGWTTNLADTTTIPGKTITSIQFSAAQLKTLMAHFKTQSEPAGGITTQPTFETAASAPETVRVPLVTRSYSDPALEPVAKGGPSDCDVVVQQASPQMFCLHSQVGSGTEGGLLWIPTGSAPQSGREIKRFRVAISTDLAPDGTQTSYFHVSFDFLGENGSIDRTLTGGAAFEYGAMLVSSWGTPGSTKYMSDLERASAPTLSTHEDFCSVFIDNPSAGDEGGVNIYPDSCYVECELEPVPFERTQDVVAEVFPAATGFGLRFFADVDGIEAPAPPPVWEDTYGFESGSWNALYGAVAISSDEVYSGTNALKVTWDADTQAGAVWMSTEALTGWAGTDCTPSLQTEEDEREGIYALEGAATSAAADAILTFAPEVYSVAEDYESGTWETDECSAVISGDEYNTGSNSLKVTIDFDALSSAFVTTESISDWDGTYCTESLVSGVGERGGSYAVKGVSTSASNNAHLEFYDTGLSADLSDSETWIMWDFKIKKAGTSANIYFKWGQNSSNYYSMHQTINGSEVPEDTWVTFVTYVQRGIEGSPTTTNVDYFAVEFNQADRTAGCEVYFCNIRIIPQYARVQNNAIGAKDFTSVDNKYRMSYLIENSSDIGKISVVYSYFSDDIWSGTTVGGTDRGRTRHFPNMEAIDTWVDRDESYYYTDGSYDVENIRSLHHRIGKGTGVFDRDPIQVLYIDTFAVNDPVTFTPGDMEIDLYGKNRYLIMLDFKIKKADTTGNIRFQYGISPAAYYFTEFDIGDFQENTWVTMILGLDGGSVAAPDMSAVDYLAVIFNKANRSTSAKIYLDNIKLVPQDVVVQNNAVGGVDLSSSSNIYKLAAYSDADNHNAPNIYLWMSSATWSGTAIGSAYRRVQIEHAATPDQWELKQQTGAAVDSGGPTMTAIASMRLTVRNSTGIYARDPVNIHYIDALHINDPDLIYSVNVGELMLHPADIISHWISEIGGEVIHSGDSSALLSALGGSAKWGFDARALGYAWEEVLQRMAFEARCNIVPIQSLIGREWRLLVADNDYGFGTSSKVITQTHDMSDVGRSIRDCASHFSFRYAFDPALPGGGTEESFTLALIATPSVSNVDIAVADIEDAAERFGAREAGPIAFRCIQDTNTAIDVAGFIVQERIANQRRVYELRNVAWFDALPYDVGDIVSITAPFSPSAVTCRITSMSKQFRSNVWTITAVEVSTAGTRT